MLIVVWDVVLLGYPACQALYSRADEVWGPVPNFKVGPHFTEGEINEEYNMLPMYSKYNLDLDF
jgi:hypothetical protein